MSLISIPTVYQRMAELWMINKKIGLTGEQLTELYDCLSLNSKYCLERAHFENLSLVASMTGDTDWQYAICEDIEKHELKMK